MFNYFQNIELTRLTIFPKLDKTRLTTEDIDHIRLTI